MSRFRLLVAGSVVVALLGLIAPTSVVAKTKAPRWVLHVRRFPGSISNGVRFNLDPAVMRAQPGTPRGLRRHRFEPTTSR